MRKDDSPQVPWREWVKPYERRVHDAMVADGCSEKEAAEIAFHMTDWLNDLDDICDIFNLETEMSNEDVASKIRGFLIHVPEHVAAAQKLSLGYGIADIFELGVCESEEES